MDLKDYLKVIKRRIFEFAVVFVIILCMYFYISKTEKDMYIATSLIQVGARGYDDSARNKQTFLRNIEDLRELLRHKQDDSIYNNASKQVVEKMKLASALPDLNPQTIDDFLLDQQERQRQFYAVNLQVGLDKKKSRRENVRDLAKGYSFIKDHFEKNKIELTDKNLQDFVFSRSKAISIGESDNSKFTNSIVVKLSTENEYVSRLIVNEVSFFAMNHFNDKNKKRMEERAERIDRWWDSPEKQDEIERIYNGVVVRYKAFKTAKFRKQWELAEAIESQFVTDFEKDLRKHKILVSSFRDVFQPDKVDELRSLKRQLADVNSRYNNLRTWGFDGTAANVVTNETEVSREIQDLLTRVDAHKQAITGLQEEREINSYRFREIDPSRRQLLLQVNDRLRNIQDQIDKEDVLLEELKEVYTDQHPRVQNAQNNIGNLKKLRAKIKEDIQNNDVARFEFRIGEIDALVRFNQDEIAKLEVDLEVKRKEMEQINDMKLHLNDITEERSRIIDRVNNLKEELAALKSQIDLEKIVDVEKYSRNVYRAPRTYTDQTLYLTIVVGLIASILVVYLREYMDTSIKTEHDVRRHMNLPVLSMIGKARNEVILTELPSKDPFAEHFNTAATLVRSAAQDLSLRSFLITSTVPQEGKTTICVDLSIALARKGLRIIIIDGDLRIPTIHEVLEVDNSSGLSTILEGNSSSEDMSGVEQYLKPTSVDNLSVLTSGPIPADPINLLESVRMKALIEELKDHCDYLIIDTPPIYNVGDTLTIASLVDATLFVVGAERVEQDQVTWAKHLLANVNANILGVFLNLVRVPGKSYYYYYNGYKSYRSRG